MKRFLVALALQGIPVFAVAATQASYLDVGALPVHSVSPDPLVDASGQRITTPEAWNRRREAIRELITHYSLGAAPTPPAVVTSQTLAQKPVLGGHASYTLTRLQFGTGPAVALDVAIYLPDPAKEKLPVFIFPTFTGTPGTERPADADKYYRSMDVETFAWNRADALRRGYAIVTYFYQDVARDRRDNRKSGVYAVDPNGDWGTIAAWAWGASRVVDYLQTTRFADPSRIALVGHSRIGKTVLAAAAYDERISLVAVAGSGCGGTGSYWVTGALRGGKEGLEEIVHKFPYWFGPRLPAFAHHVEQLPFDESWLMALVAPRPLLSTEALQDASCNPRASAASYTEALPVYTLLGAADNLGLHYRPGIHELNDDDWQTVLDFADHHLRGVPAHADFHTVPADLR